MGDSIDIAMREIDRRKNAKRRQRLFEIIQLILDGKIDGSATPLAGIFNQSGPRQTYISPQNRGGYNSGQVQIDELLGSNYE